MKVSARLSCEWHRSFRSRRPITSMVIVDCSG
jgi:hypothetical protein